MHRARLDLVTAAARTISAFTVRCSPTTPAILGAATSTTRSPHQCSSINGLPSCAHRMEHSFYAYL